MYKFSSLPITLGITGHRDLKDIENINTLLVQEVSYLQSLYPNSELIILSALAEGADRMLADIAKQKKLPLHVILPFHKEEYEKDFPNTVNEFRVLYNYALETAGIHVIDPVVPESETLIPLKDDQSSNIYRNLQYAKAGMFLAERSHILFALWDGKKARGLGGTAQIVDFKLKGRISNEDLIDLKAQIPNIKYYLDHSNPLDHPDVGIVCHIKVCRSKEQYLEEQTVPHVYWHPYRPKKYASIDSIDKKQESYLQSLQRTEELNVRIREKLSTPSNQSQHNFYEDVFNAIDTLANQDMQDIRLRYKTIFFIAGLMAIAGNRVLSSDYLTFASVVFSLLLITILAILLKKIHYTKANQLAIQLRTLAEGLRIQNMWHEAMIQQSVALHYLGRNNPEVVWVRRALLGTCIHSVNDKCLSVSQSKIIEWIKSQSQYLHDRIQAKSNKNKKISKSALIFFSLGIFTIIIICICSFINILSYTPSPILQAINLILQYIAEISLTCAALCAGYSKFLGLEEDIIEYRNSAELFDFALSNLQESSLVNALNSEDLHNLVYALGVESLQENTRWLKRTVGQDIDLIGR